MANLIYKKIHIGISACQHGAKVRYNSKGWDMTDKLGREKGEFVWHPVCPEVMSGLGVPRSPISLRKGNGDDFWNGVATIKSREGEDKSEMLRKGCESCLSVLETAKVDVFIFMEGSPTCGVYRTTLRGSRMGKPPGIFGSKLLEKNIFLIPAVDLQSPIKWWDWRRRMYAYVWLKDLECNKLSELYDVWHNLKFLCQEINRSEADGIGAELAHESSDNSKFIEKIRSRILDMLRRPVDVKRIKQNLWKNYSFLRKKKGINLDEIFEPTDIRSMTHLANEMIELEIEAREKDILFGSSPVRRARKNDLEEKI